MIGFLRRYRRLRARGVLGINLRNAAYVLPGNPRAAYPRVDDKLLTKQLAAAAGIPMPRLLGVVSYHHELHDLPRLLSGLHEFVLKPARGAQGNGIVVITGVEDGMYRRSSGARLTDAQLRQHVSSTLSGVFSLGGDADVCVIEARVVAHPQFHAVARFGIPDLRVIVYRGLPVMAMCRLPTVASDGRANLHQGAIAVGIDLATGRGFHAAHHHRAVTHHVDTGAPLLGFPVPHWQQALLLATRASDISGLQYVGVDVIIDDAHGPLLLELNARPGLAIQVANDAGLLPRLRRAETIAVGPQTSPTERCALAAELFGRRGS
jgi:alpha-L-glutamate ligase-like protein